MQTPSFIYPSCTSKCLPGSFTWVPASQFQLNKKTTKFFIYPAQINFSSCIPISVNCIAIYTSYVFLRVISSFSLSTWPPNSSATKFYCTKSVLFTAYCSSPHYLSSRSLKYLAPILISPFGAFSLLKSILHNDVRVTTLKINEMQLYLQ